MASLPIRFFKMILKTNLQSLKLPKNFTERYGGALTNPVFLKPPYGNKWKVYWTKKNDDKVWFEKGWKEFAENYCLDEGYMVVFEYDGSSHFDVKILGQNALEIDYDPLGENLDQNDDGSVIFLGTFPDQKSKQKSVLLSPPTYKKDKGENAAERSSLPLNWPRGARAQEVAKGFISNNPFFTITIKPIDLKENRRYAPSLEGYFENVDKNVKLQIGERSWDVKLLRRCATRGRCFSAGWSLFAKESELQEGDVCVFELIDMEDLVFKVHVYPEATLDLSD